MKITTFFILLSLSIGLSTPGSSFSMEANEAQNKKRKTGPTQAIISPGYGSGSQSSSLPPRRHPGHPSYAVPKVAFLQVPAAAVAASSSYTSNVSVPAAAAFAQQNAPTHVLAIPEIPLISITNATEERNIGIQNFTDLFSNLPPSLGKENLRKAQEIYCTRNQCWSNLINATQHLEELEESGAQHELIEQAKLQEAHALALHTEQDKLYKESCQQMKKHHSWTTLLCYLTERQRELHFAQALVLRSEKEEVTQRLQAQIQQLTAQNQQLQLQLLQQTAPILDSPQPDQFQHGAFAHDQEQQQ